MNNAPDEAGGAWRWVSVREAARLLRSSPSSIRRRVKLPEGHPQRLEHEIDARPGAQVDAFLVRVPVQPSNSTEIDGNRRKSTESDDAPPDAPDAPQPVPMARVPGGPMPPEGVRLLTFPPAGTLEPPGPAGPHPTTGPPPRGPSRSGTAPAPDTPRKPQGNTPTTPQQPPETPVDPGQSALLDHLGRAFLGPVMEQLDRSREQNEAKAERIGRLEAQLEVVRGRVEVVTEQRDAARQQAAGLVRDLAAERAGRELAERRVEELEAAARERGAHRAPDGPRWPEAGRESAPDGPAAPSPAPARRWPLRVLRALYGLD